MLCNLAYILGGKTVDVKGTKNGNAYRLVITYQNNGSNKTWQTASAYFNSVERKSRTYNIYLYVIYKLIVAHSLFSAPECASSSTRTEEMPPLKPCAHTAQINLSGNVVKVQVKSDSHEIDFNVGFWLSLVH